MKKRDHKSLTKTQEGEALPQTTGEESKESHPKVNVTKNKAFHMPALTNDIY